MEATPPAPIQRDNTDLKDSHDAYLEVSHGHCYGLFPLSSVDINPSVASLSHRHKTYEDVLTGDRISKTGLVAAGFSESQATKFCAVIDGKGVTNLSDEAVESYIGTSDTIAEDMSGECMSTQAQPKLPSTDPHP